MTTLLNTLYSHFGRENVIQIEKRQGVFLCEKKTADNETYQVIFIDMTDNWREENYSQYLESVVIDRYYQTASFIQWNFYYYIITTKEKINESIVRKKDIEIDETYTRKSVLTEVEFIDWVNSFDSISKISEDSISSDLYSNWVKYLREKKLYFVYNSLKYPNYKQPIEDFINEASFDDIEETEQNEFTDTLEPTLNNIKSLDLSNQFREYPLIKEFALGKVNLIHGANAVGKTSFFDAIELIITGKLFYKDTCGDYKIQLITDTNTILNFPSRPAPYKKRDIQWYNSGLNRGNELNEHFNKFNYFTSDAAFQLKQDDNNKQNNLQEVITEIALGREVNKLEERIKSIAEGFKNWTSSFLKESTRLNKELSEKNEIINELNKNQNNPQGYKKALIEALKNNFWKTNISEGEESISILDNEINAINNILFNIKSSNIEVEKSSIESVDKELKELNNKKLSISNTKNEILKSQQQRQEYLKEVEKIKSILPMIEDLTAFFNHDQFHLLIGLEKNIKQKNGELNKANEIKQFSDAIISNELFTKESEQTKNIKQIEEEIIKIEESLNIRLKETELKINQIEEGIEELSIIISNIKSSGQSYFKLNPKAEYCPLCNTHFNNKDLADAIQRTQESFSNSIVLTSLKEELEFIKKRLEETDIQIEAVKKLKTLAFSIFASTGLEKPINEIQKSSVENTKTLAKLTETLIQLNTVLSLLKNSNLTEDKFLTLLNRVEDFLSLKIQSNTELDIQKQTLLEKQNELTSAILKLDKIISEKQTLLNTSFTVEIENEEKLLKRLNMLQEIESNFNQLEIYLNIPANTALINILEKVRFVKSVFETYKKAAIELKQQNQVAELTKKEIDKILAEIELIKPKQDRAQIASNELNNLLKEQSKNDFLSDYITKNKKEIVSIFKLIHNPSEFKDINFIENKITLITNTESERTLSEISTGQRSALALSIFLSLNKKLSKGPNILMFDDPVT
ncbi:MAG: hypothetical protein LKG19_03230 [Saprospiraceae bacterium]|jgi:DNA repair protein SbcC/Rad50|nr:hypothetical protein [Saprospiraceae bacterium]